MAIALQMGFERVVLCGMPMNGGDGILKAQSCAATSRGSVLESPNTDLHSGLPKRSDRMGRKTTLQHAA